MRKSQFRLPAYQKCLCNQHYSMATQINPVHLYFTRQRRRWRYAT